MITLTTITNIGTTADAIPSPIPYNVVNADPLNDFEHILSIKIDSGDTI